MVEIYNDDCLNIMGGMEDSSVDLILTDPPYGSTRNKWDGSISFDPLWRQYNRIIKDDGVILVFGDEPFSSLVRTSNLKSYRYDWIWKKESGTGFLNSKKMPLKIFENIMVFYKRLPLYNPQMRDGFKAYMVKQSSGSGNYGDYKRVTTTSSGERYPINILNFSRDRERYHPAQKPVALLEYLIKTYTDPGMVVLDSFMGSGSTGVATINTDRNFIGIELDEGYFSISKERLAKAQGQHNKDTGGQYEHEY